MPFQAGNGFYDAGSDLFSVFGAAIMSTDLYDRLNLLDLFDLFVAAWAFFGAGLALVLGTGILLSAWGRARGPEILAARVRNRIFFALCVCLSWFLLIQSLAFSGVLFRWPRLLWTDTPFVFCLGPLLYLFYRARTGNEFLSGAGLAWRDALHLIAPATAVILLWPLYALDDPERVILLRELAQGEALPDLYSPNRSDYLRIFRTGSFAQTPVLWIVTFASEASIVAYTLPILWNLRDVFRPRTFLAGPGFAGDASAIRWITAALAVETSVLAALGLGALAGSVNLARWSVIGVTTLICVLFFVDRAFPAYFDRIFEIARSTRYRKSRLENLEVDRIAALLRDEMRVNQPYLRDDLTLPELARSLSITPHQLSEFLNDRLGKNFHTLINEYRVQAACTLLVETDDTVLSIAYATGFNNRASFNAAFLKFTGTTPIAYRRSAAVNSAS